jgi:hypothetical protein
MIRHRRPRARSCDLPFSIHFCQTFSSSSMVSTCARSMRSLLGVGFLPAKKSGRVAYLIRHSLFSAESGAPGFGPLRGENQPKYCTKGEPACVKNRTACKPPQGLFFDSQFTQMRFDPAGSLFRSRSAAAVGQFVVRSTPGEVGVHSGANARTAGRIFGRGEVRARMVLKYAVWDNVLRPRYAVGRLV